MGEGMSSSCTPWQHYLKRKGRLQSELAPHYAKMVAGEPVCMREITRLNRELAVSCKRLAELEAMGNGDMGMVRHIRIRTGKEHYDGKHRMVGRTPRKTCRVWFRQARIANEQDLQGQD